ncbi:MAG: T9SS type A sorting domain-containing protein [Bacteroidetes bacterium]|nr:T9SS type A sorting domain-containing protein [Bacteroidota bacterium]
MQYRTSTSGTWTDFSSVSEFSSLSASTTYRTSGSSVTLTTTLPVACENVSTVQLRWCYYLLSGSNGSRPELAFDDITVSSTACSAPTATSTSLTFSNVSSSQMDLSWTLASSGGGLRRMVVAKSGSAPTTTPTNATTYTANSVFGTSGTTIATGEYVVYNGTGTGVTVTNLSAGTTYYFTIYENNCSVGNETYYTTPLSGNQATNAGSTITTGSISGSPFCSVNAAAVSVSFTSSGSFSSNTYTAQLSSSSGSFSSPTSIGTLSSNLNSGTISASIPSGTSAGSGYRIRVVSNGPTVTGGDNGSNLTIVSTQSDVTSLAASVVAGQTVVSWTNPSSCIDDVLIVVRQGTSVTSGTPTGDGSSYTKSLTYASGSSLLNGYTCYQGSTSGQTITGLTNGLDYYVKVFVRYGTSWSSGTEIIVTPNNGTTYYSRSSGTSATATWSTSRTTGSTITNPFGTTVSFIVQNGHTVEMAASGINANHITVEAGGKLWRNSNTSGNMRYFNVFGNITCDGLIGDSTSGGAATFDAIGFNVEGTSCTISGTGKFYGGRIRKSAITNATTSVTYAMNATLTFPGASMYSNVDASYLNTTINSGKTLTISDAIGDFSIDGVNGASTGERGGTVTVNGTLSVANAIYFTTNNTTNTCKFIINSGGTISAGNAICSASGSAKDSVVLKNGGLLKFTATSGGFGSYSSTNNYFGLGTGSTVQYSASGNQTIETGLTYSNLILSGSGDKSFTGTLNINKNIDQLGSITFTPGSSAIINILGDWTTYSNTSFQAGTSTVNLNGTRQIVKSTGTSPNDYEGFSTLNISSGDTLELGSNIQISTSLTTSGVLLAGGYVVNLKTSTTPTCTFNSGATLMTTNTSGVNGTLALTASPSLGISSNFIFNGTSAQNAGTLLPTSVNNLTATSAGLTLGANCTVNGTLTLNGKITTGTSTLGLTSAATLSGATSTKYVVGNFMKNVAVGSSVSRTFEIGTSTAYTPVTLDFTSVTTTGNVTATSTDNDHGSISSSCINSAKSVNRNWTISNVNTAFTSYDITCNFLSADVDAGASTSSFIGQQYSSGSWADLTAGTLNSTNSKFTGLTIFGDIQIGELGVPSVSGVSATPTNHQVVVAWTNPTGSCYDSIMIVAKKKRVVTFSPTLGHLSYTGNLTYGSGTSYDTGYVVYKGVTSPQTITNLDNDTIYYFTLYAWKNNVWGTGVNTSATPYQNTITTLTISGSPFCVSASTGTSVSVPFSYNPSSHFTNGSCTFTAELSDATGSFSSPTSIGTITSDASGSQSISATIPANTASGTAYRIRVSSTTPSVTGTQNSVNLTVNLGPVNSTSVGATAGNGTATIAWTNPATCYDDVMIVCGTSSFSSTNPSGNSYTANLAFGSGTTFGSGNVVYQGSTSSQIISGLASGTLYYIKVFTRKGTDWSSGVEVTVTPTATITTGTISGSPFSVTNTVSTSVSVPFTSSGNFGGSNTYTAQLSNSSGSFTSPVTLGSVSSTANSGTISGTIPAATATGTSYRIRVISSSPSVTGADNGTNLTINLINPVISFSSVNKTLVEDGTTTKTDSFKINISQSANVTVTLVVNGGAAIGTDFTLRDTVYHKFITDTVKFVSGGPTSRTLYATNKISDTIPNGMKKAFLGMTVNIGTIGTKSVDSLVLQDDEPVAIINKYVNSGASTAYTNYGSFGTNDSIDILVIKDHLDMRGMVMKDFSGNVAGDKGGSFTFTTNTYWSDVRAGTLITVRIGTSMSSANSIDTVKGCGDFLISLDLFDTRYFTNTTPAVSGGTRAFDISSDEMVMLKASGFGVPGVFGSIHALTSSSKFSGSGTVTSGSNGYFYSITSVPKAYGSASTSSSSTKYACINNNGTSITDFNGYSTTSPTTVISGTTTQKMGLKNSNGNGRFINNKKSTPQSDIIATTGFTYPTNINYVNYQAASGLTTSNAVNVFGITIRDGGASGDNDADPTILSAISFTVNQSNYLRSAALYDGTTKLAETTVSGTTFSFSGFTASTVTDGSTKNLKLYVTFKNGSIADGTRLTYTVASVTNVTGYSCFAAANGGAASSSTSGNDNKIDVVASKLKFTTQPINVSVNSVQSSVVVTAKDVNNNSDLDNTDSVALLVAVASFSSSATIKVKAVNGVATFSNLIYNSGGFYSYLTATDIGLTDGTSDSFNVISNNSLSDIIVKSGFSYPTNIDYKSYQSATGLTTSNTVDVFELRMRDGGSSLPDGDNKSTTLTSISFTLTNDTLLRTAALFDSAGTKLSEVTVSGTTLTFSGLNYPAPDDSKADLSLRFTFKTNITDHQQISIAVSNVAANGAGSVFAATNGGGASSSTAGSDNKLEVTASKLVFSVQPTYTLTSPSVMTPDVKVYAKDIFNNIDIDYSSSVSITSSTATLTSSPLAVNASNGLATFTAMDFTAPGTAGTLTATSGILTNATSDTFSVDWHPSAYMYRTNGTGSWFTPGTWQYSTNGGSSWTNSTSRIPTYQAATIRIMQGDSISANTSTQAITIDQLTIDSGGKFAWVNGANAITINNGAGTDLDIKGTLIHDNTGSNFLIFSSGATGVVESSGMIEVRRSGAGSSINYGGTSTGSFPFTYKNGAVFYWNNSSTNFTTTSYNYLTTTAATDTPIFRIGKNGGAVSVGTSANDNTIGGILEVVSGGNVTWNGAGKKTFRNGVRNYGILKQSNGCGRWIISGGGKIGGTGVLTLDTGGIRIPTGTTTSLENDKTINAGKITVDGTFDSKSFYMDGSGAFKLSAGANLITSFPGGTGFLQNSGGRTLDATANYTFNGGFSQNTGSNLPSIIHNLTIDNASGNVVLTKTTQVNGTATINANKLVTVNDTLVLGTSATLVESAGKFVVGKVAATRTIGTTTQETFGNLGIDITPNGSNAPGSTVVVRTTGHAQTGQLVHDSLGATHHYDGIKRYFSITPTNNANLGTTITFHYDANELNGLSASSLVFYRASHIDTSHFEYKGVGSRSGNTVTLASVDSFSIWTLGSGSTPLPVELTLFTAQLKGNNTALLSWTTASEINNNHFDIERSVDAKTFTKVTEVKGNGTTNNITDYSYMDVFGALPARIIYYRLKQVDDNGAFEYSPIYKLNLTTNADNTMKTYYAKDADKTIIMVTTDDKETYQAEVIDATGNVVIKQSMPVIASPSSMIIDMQTLNKGIYFIRVSNANRSFGGKVLKY